MKIDRDTMFDLLNSLTNVQSEIDKVKEKIFKIYLANTNPNPAPTVYADNKKTKSK